MSLLTTSHSQSALDTMARMYVARHGDKADRRVLLLAEFAARHGEPEAARPLLDLLDRVRIVLRRQPAREGPAG